MEKPVRLSDSSFRIYWKKFDRIIFFEEVGMCLPRLTTFESLLKAGQPVPFHVAGWGRFSVREAYPGLTRRAHNPEIDRDDRSSIGGSKGPSGARNSTPRYQAL